MGAACLRTPSLSGMQMRNGRITSSTGACTLHLYIALLSQVHSWFLVGLIKDQPKLFVVRNFPKNIQASLTLAYKMMSSWIFRQLKIQTICPVWRSLAKMARLTLEGQLWVHHRWICSGLARFEAWIRFPGAWWVFDCCWRTVKDSTLLTELLLATCCPIHWTRSANIAP